VWIASHSRHVTIIVNERPAFQIASCQMQKETNYDGSLSELSDWTPGSSSGDGSEAGDSRGLTSSEWLLSGLRSPCQRDAVLSRSLLSAAPAVLSFATLVICLLLSRLGDVCVATTRRSECICLALAAMSQRKRANGKGAGAAGAGGLGRGSDGRRPQSGAAGEAGVDGIDADARCAALEAWGRGSLPVPMVTVFMSV
jgi:hypothetical protein